MRSPWKGIGPLILRTIRAAKTWLLCLAVLAAVAVCGGAGLILVVDAGMKQEAEVDHKCCWSQVSATSVAQTLSLRVPAKATALRAGVKRDYRSIAVALLSFTLRSRDADLYLARLVPRSTPMVVPGQAAGAMRYPGDASFRHLGLPEPAVTASALSVRQAYRCVETQAGNIYADHAYCIDVYRSSVAGAKGMTRLYFRSVVAG